MEGLRSADSLPFPGRCAVAGRHAEADRGEWAWSWPPRPVSRTVVAAAGAGARIGSAGAGLAWPAGRVVAGHAPGEFRIECGDHGPDPGKTALEACVRPRAVRRPGVGS